jgi:hypothetical protein
MKGTDRFCNACLTPANQPSQHSFSSAASAHGYGHWYAVQATSAHSDCPPAGRNCKNSSNARKTLTLPKPLVEFANKPMILHQIQALAAAGVTDIVLAVNYRPEIMTAALKKVYFAYSIFQGRPADPPLHSTRQNTTSASSSPSRPNHSAPLVPSSSPKRFSERTMRHFSC